jgi:hypothetical protein
MAADELSYLYPHAWPGRVGSDAAPFQVATAAEPPVMHLLASEHTEAGGCAVIGNALRIPAVWCQLGSCISRFTDAAALGESDVRSRALAAGWREDAVGRLACPDCVQHEPAFWVSCPPVPWLAPVVAPTAGMTAEEQADQTRAVAAPANSRDDQPSPRLRLAAPVGADDEALTGCRHRDVGRHRQRI